MKRLSRIILSLTLAVFLSATLLPERVRAITASGVVDNFDYYLNESGVFFVKPIDPNGNTIFKGYFIPSNYRQYVKRLYFDTGTTGITAISPTNSADNHTGPDLPALVEVTLPSSLKNISSGAFANQTTLEKVNIPGSVNVLESSVFYGCTSLKDVTLEEGILTIPSYFFYKCTSLKNITLPSSLLNIHEQAFGNCTSLTSIRFGKKVSSIGNYAFYSCTALTDIYFEGPAPSIEGSAFFDVTADVYTPTGTNEWPRSAMTDYCGARGKLTWMTPYPYITSHPSDRTVLANNDTHFYAAGASVNGWRGLSYKWQWSYTSGSTWSNLLSGSNYSGEDTSHLIVTPYANYDGFMFRCVVTDINGKSTTTNPATLHVVTTPKIVKLENEGTGGGVKLTLISSNLSTLYVQRMTGNSTYQTIKDGVAYGDLSDKTATKMGEKYTYRIKGSLNDVTTSYSDSVSIIRNPFKDVNTSDTHFSKIAWAYNSGIITGKTSTSFAPSENCTRAQMAVMLWKMNGRPSVSGTNPFKDISSYTANVQKAILWCYKQGIVEGYGDGTYRPDNPVTRAQMVVMLYRMAGEPQVSGSVPFKDISSCGPTTKKAILWAYNNGITKGTSGTAFSPSNPCLRLQLVIFLYRYNDIYQII